uniref:AcidPPc domain-containing protein n=1 Tax=Wuchereria bancrofti TaxID=6293 RepID=A0A1I8ECR6_WUCBA
MVDVQTQLWIWDHEITSFMVLNSGIDSQSNLRFIFLCMEWSMHGALWLIFSSFIFLVSMRYNFSLNMRHELAVLIFGLCADLVVVGIIKGIARRSRPPFDIKDQLYEAPLVDKFSFPSGHSSRGAMLSAKFLHCHFGNFCTRLANEALFSRFSLTFFCSLPQFITLFVKLFPFVLGASRIFIGRHYVSDVMIGLLLGYAEGNFVQCLPLHTVDALKQMFPLIFGSNEQRDA